VDDQDGSETHENDRKKVWSTWVKKREQMVTKENDGRAIGEKRITLTRVHESE
jgi:hypothetical protein